MTFIIHSFSQTSQVWFIYKFRYIIFILPDVKLGFTDTDSFLYSLPSTENIYSKLRKIDPEEKWMDFSNYSEQHPNFSRKNHLIPGKFKDEGAGMDERYVFPIDVYIFF